MRTLWTVLGVLTVSGSFTLIFVEKGNENLVMEQSGIDVLFTHWYPAAIVLLCVFGITLFTFTQVAVIQFLRK